MELNLNNDGLFEMVPFFGQQCCLEYKRHDYEKGIIKVKTESGNPDSSPAQIRRRVQTASSGHGPQWAAGAPEELKLWASARMCSTAGSGRPSTANRTPNSKLRNFASGSSRSRWNATS